ncbi:DUF485 domain-containing protein [Streptomyces sp. NPDC014870]|uniref:DUF485 domain-containing protein n=1 Tax=Streptomyces sp. NPDC014870 TaxID=3364925 RepID=UPI0036FAD2A1
MEKDEGPGVPAVRIDDPWYDALASGWGESAGAEAAAGEDMTADPAAGAVPRQQAEHGSGWDVTDGSGRGFGHGSPHGSADGPMHGSAHRSTRGSVHGAMRGAEHGSTHGADRRTAAIYLEVQRSPAFQEVRSRYRRFVIPAALAFLLWYLAYVVAATAAPGLMARPVIGMVNVAMLAGLGQFLTTFLLTWAYARHARLRRDRAALELRWTVFDETRGVQG